MMLSPLVQAGALQTLSHRKKGGGDEGSIEPFAIPPLVNFAHILK